MNKKLIPMKNILFYKNFWYNLIEILKQDSFELKKILEEKIIFFNEINELEKLLNLN
jgi:hypothetical protein